MKKLLLLVGLAASATSAAAPPKNTLHWKVVEGKGIFGYLVYRADVRAGPFLRASPKLIRTINPHVDKDLASEYQYVDADVEAGKTYYYFIDVVDMSGRKQRLSGVQKQTVTAK